jgi:hypothetical protein
MYRPSPEGVGVSQQQEIGTKRTEKALIDARKQTIKDEKSTTQLKTSRNRHRTSGEVLPIRHAPHY